ncbi:MAG: winged helix-turn-helix domain-containing protein [Gammaproteobacteria bacterium]
MNSTNKLPALLLDLTDERLWRGDEQIPLTPKAFALLRYLVEHPNVLLTKEALLENVWPDVYVVEQVLRHYIQELRQVLGDNSDVSRYIETVRGRGYRFIGAITIRTEAPPPVALPVILDRPAAPTPDTASTIVTFDPPAASAREEPIAPEPQAVNPVPIESPRWKNRRWAATAALVILLLGGAVWYFYPRAPLPLPTASMAVSAKHRIAVLPFVNLSADPENEYFSDGITEELISKLSRINELRVIARTSVMAYKKSAKKISEIGQELNIGTVLEGSVRKAGDKVRITAQLIDVESQAHLWSQDYDRDLKDIFTIQTDVTQQVADALQVSLLATEQRQIEKRGTESLEAYNLYLLGLYHLRKYSPEEMNQGIEYFQRAITIDPRYAQAYAWMATGYDNMAWNGLLPEQEGFAKAKATALKALELDDTNAEAYGVMGDVYGHEWNRPACKNVLERALQLNPNSAWARETYGITYLGAMGRYQEALVEMERALALDPLSLVYRHDYAWVLTFARQYDRAIEEFQKVAAVSPDYGNVYRGLGELYGYQSRYKESIAAMHKLVDVYGSTPYALASLGWAYGVAGQKDAALEILEVLTRRAKTQKVESAEIARVYLGLGDKQQALDWFEKNYEEHAGGWVLVFAKSFPFFDPLRSEPRFIELLKKLGLEN